VTSIAFDDAPVSLSSFDIDLSGTARMTALTNEGNKFVDFEDDFYAEGYLPEGWSAYFIRSITFDLSSGSKLFVDDIKYTPTPPTPAHPSRRTPRSPHRRSSTGATAEPAVRR
jgi:hypothetical protein